MVVGVAHLRLYGEKNSENRFWKRRQNSPLKKNSSENLQNQNVPYLPISLPLKLVLSSFLIAQKKKNLKIQWNPQTLSLKLSPSARGWSPPFSGDIILRKFPIQLPSPKRTNNSELRSENNNKSDDNYKSNNDINKSSELSHDNNSVKSDEISMRKKKTENLKKPKKKTRRKISEKN